MAETQFLQSAFPPTRWTQVIELKGELEEPAANRILTSLCNQYWYPLYAYARRFGKGQHDAQDLTQGFFQHIIEKNLFSAAIPELGKMRTFLLQAFRRFIIAADRHLGAQKRGGQQVVLSLDIDEGEDRYRLEPTDNITPELLYERAWAHQVILQTHEELRRREEALGKGKVFEKLSGVLTLNEEAGNLAEISKELGISHEGLRQYTSRLRKQFRALLRESIANTLNAPTTSAVTDEMEALKAAVAAQPFSYSAGAGAGVEEA